LGKDGEYLTDCLTMEVLRIIEMVGLKGGTQEMKSQLLPTEIVEKIKLEALVDCITSGFKPVKKFFAIMFLWRF